MSSGLTSINEYLPTSHIVISSKAITTFKYRVFVSVFTITNRAYLFDSALSNNLAYVESGILLAACCACKVVILFNTTWFLDNTSLRRPSSEKVVRIILLLSEL